MKSPFVRFTLIFVVIVLVAFGAVLLLTGRLPVNRPLANARFPDSSMQPMQPLPDSAAKIAAPLPDARSFPDPGNPPDLVGLNFQEVAIPGADLPQPTPPVPEVAGSENYVAELMSHKLELPIEKVKASDLHDTFGDARGPVGSPGRHEAIDIMAPRGTPVHALGDGNIVKLFTSKRGGLTIYEFEDAQKYCFYYAHLDRYADNLKEGMRVRAGDTIGFVGSTGDADAGNPHLHFALSLLDTDKKYWKGTALNPYPVLSRLASAVR